MTAEERAKEAERIARRVAKQHPDPRMRETLRWIAERAAQKAREPDGGL